MRHHLVFLATAALLAGCGTTQPERTSGGAAAGAATGAGVGALAGPPGMVVGALVGGGAGAATGAATKPSDVNLGKPPWTNPETRVPGTTRTASRNQSAATQHASVEQLNDRSLQAAQHGSSFNP
jgi:phage tail tape-measure protein